MNTSEETIIINPIYSDFDSTVVLAIDEQDNLMVITDDDIYIAAGIEDALDVFEIYAPGESARLAWEAWQWA